MVENQQIEGVVKSASGRLDKVLADEGIPLSRNRLQQLIREGWVYINGKPVEDTSFKIKIGDNFLIQVPPALEAKPRPQEIQLDILYEDADLIVLNKPAGMVVHPGAGNPEDTLVNALLHHCKESLSGIGGVLRPGIVHRIDKQTSGILVVAKNDQTHQELSKQFSSHHIHRVYHALVWKVPKDKKGTIDAPLGRHPKDRQRMAITKSGKRAVTHYQILENFGTSVSLLACKLETGRTHQIRVHLTSLGHPLLGDPVYGAKLPAGISNTSVSQLKEKIEFFGERQALHALELGFVHPKTGESLLFTSSYPQDFQNILAAVREIFEG